jgi:cell division protease FtsH
VKAENMIAFLMGGRVAEEAVFNQKTTGAGHDIERATEVARRMVCEWGMSDILGPLTFGKKEEAIFLGREISQHRDYSEQTAQTIDREVRDIVERNYHRAKEIIAENIAALHRIAEALLEYETIDGEEVDQLIAGQKLVRAPKVVPAKPDEGGGAAPAPVLA